MTDMKRITVSLPDELVEALDAIKANEEFGNMTMSQIIRMLIQRGLDKANEE